MTSSIQKNELVDSTTHSPADDVTSSSRSIATSESGKNSPVECSWRTVMSRGTGFCTVPHVYPSVQFIHTNQKQVQTELSAVFKSSTRITAGQKGLQARPLIGGAAVLQWERVNRPPTVGPTPKFFTLDLTIKLYGRSYSIIYTAPLHAFNGRLINFSSTCRDFQLNLVKDRLVTWLLHSGIDYLLTSDFRPLSTPSNAVWKLIFSNSPSIPLPCCPSSECQCLWFGFRHHYWMCARYINACIVNTTVFPHCFVKLFNNGRNVWRKDQGPRCNA